MQHRRAVDGEISEHAGRYGATVAHLRRIFLDFSLAPQAVFKGVKFMHITLNSPGL